MDTNFKFSRYIFFSNVFTSDAKKNPYQLTQDEIKNYFKSPFKTQLIEQYNSENEAVNEYIKNYIAFLEDLRNNEYASEKAFIDQLQEKTKNRGVQLDLEDVFQKNKNFDYIKFITKINQLLTNQEILADIVKNNKTRFEQIKNALEDLNKNKQTITITKTNEQFDAYEYLIKAYEEKYSLFTRNIPKYFQEKTIPLFSEEVSKYLNRQLQSLATDQNFLTTVKKIIDARKNINYKDFLNIIIEILINNMKDMSFLQKTMIDQINEIGEEQLLQQAEQTIIDINGLLTQETTSFDAILDAFFSTREGVARLIEENGESYNQLILLMENNGISKSDMTYKMIDTNYQNLKKALQPGSKATSDTIKKIRMNLTKSVNALLSDLTKTKKEIIEDKEARAQKVQEISFKWMQDINTKKEMAAMVSQYLAESSLNVADTGEFLSTVGLEQSLKKELQLYIPGKPINLKADIIFSFVPQPIDNFFNTLNLPINPNLQLFSNFLKTFLLNYKKQAKGQTDVGTAIEVWKTEQQKNIEEQQRLLNNLQTEKERKELSAFFEKIIHGSISVKTYSFYSNELGYHAGSLGGSGKVIQAIPQIIKMLETGGLTDLDANLIIDTLLNCFDDSVIGTQPWDQIQNLLLGGAAMLLFDDGFANATKFLEEQKEKLVAGTSLGKTLHLLYLNNIYIPQSYFLTKVIEQLKIIEDDLLKIPTEISSNNKSRLVLTNPLSNKDWNAENPQAVSEYAQREVKISFLFMAGMLDIMQGMEKLFIQ